MEQTQLITFNMPRIAKYIDIIGRTGDKIMEQNWVVKLTLAIFSTLAPIEPYTYFLIFLLVMDANTAIYLQYKENLKSVRDAYQLGEKRIRKRRVFFATIESSKLRATLEKLVSYIFTIIICFLFDKIVLQITPLEGQPLQHFSVANIAIVLISSVELVSILANFSKITNNPVYGKIIRIFQKKVDDKLDDL